MIHPAEKRPRYYYRHMDLDCTVETGAAFSVCLGPEERATALLCTSTATRLRLAREGLLDQHEMLEELLETHGERIV